jgi:uncharacterized membrane protein YgcG
VALVGAAVPASALPARAGGCDTVVVDGARMLGDGKDVRRAAAALAAHHATVRVRTYPSVPDGDLDAAIAAETSRCASWHDPDGRRRADLLVLAVSLEDRHTGVYYGTGWTAALDDHQEAVQTSTVNPLLRRGKYSAAVTGGLTSLGRLLPARPARAADVVTDTTVDPAGDPLSDVDLSDQDGPGLPGESPSALLGVLAVVGVAGAGGVMVLAVARGGRRSGRGRSSRRWNSSDGIDQGYSSGFGSASGLSGSGFSGGSDAGSSASSSSSDGGGGSTSW